MREQDIFDESRRHFQLERLILFSDAVFAIAITLLVIDVKLPVTNWSSFITKAVFNQYLHNSIPQLMGFVFSFFIIGFYWTTHHRMFGFVKNYDTGVIWLNMLLLFFIVLLPFTTSLTSEYGYLNESFMLYCINVGFVGLVSFFLQLHISNPKKDLSIGLEDKNLRNFIRSKSLVSSLLFFIGAAFCLTDNEILSTIARFIYVFIFPGVAILKRVYHIKK